MEAECLEVTSHGRHPLALSPDVFARGCLFTCFLRLRFLFGWIFLEVPGAAFIWMPYLKSVPVRFSFLLRFEGLEYYIGRIHLINL